MFSPFKYLFIHVYIPQPLPIIVILRSLDFVVTIRDIDNLCPGCNVVWQVKRTVRW